MLARLVDYNGRLGCAKRDDNEGPAGILCFYSTVCKVVRLGARQTLVSIFALRKVFSSESPRNGARDHLWLSHAANPCVVTLSTPQLLHVHRDHGRAAQPAQSLGTMLMEAS